MAKSIAREFLGWNRPLLQSAVEWLARRYLAASELDLSGVTVVLPGRRGGRRLLELLVLQAESERLRLTPPRIATVGELPEQLYPLQRPLASDLVQQLTWAKVLRESKQAELKQVIPHPPAADDALAWWALGTLLWNEHCELARDGFDFGDVAEIGHKVPGFAETARWDSLQKTQAAYLRALDGLGLWDVQTARLVAIERREPQTDRDIVLVGTVDMNLATRQILDRVAGQVTALIAAPKERAKWFDAHGCLEPDLWNDAEIEIPEERVRVCDDPAEQAAQVARELSLFGKRYRSDEVVIGLTDQRLGPFIERQLAACGATTRWIEGKRLADSGPCRLLSAAAEALDRGRYDDFAALLRHPDLEVCLGPNVDLARLDEVFSRHLPLGLESLRQILEQNNFKGSSYDLLVNVGRLLAPLQVAARALHEWAAPLRAWLASVYGRREVNESTSDGRVLVAALKRLNEILDDMEGVPSLIAPIVTAADAIRCALRRISDEFVPPEVAENAVELLGWLELPLDDTPAAIVTSFNEGFVPTSLNSDLFLPNELRQRLGLNDNTRRYARDAYAVALLQQTRRDVVWLVARRDADGNPLMPSRLLFAVEADRLPRRVLQLIGEEPMPRNQSKVLVSGGSAPKSGLSIPRPEQIVSLLGCPELLTPAHELRLNVTEFKSYIACPYRYFLRHVLKLESCDDRAVEMDGLMFGNVLHEVLRLFGASEDRDATDEARLQKCLVERLDEVAQERFGTKRRAAVKVQLKQLEARLEAFAHWQAKWRRAGWRIEHVELSIDPKIGDSIAPSFRVDNATVWLHGRLDRVDRNEVTGECVIFDYKSGDRGALPEESHRKKGDWIDLQLPLYRHLARNLALPSEPRLGYINLPKDLAGVAAALAEWSPDDLADADEKAKQVACGIARRQFWPPAATPPGMFSEFNDVCHVGVFGAGEGME